MFFLMVLEAYWPKLIFAAWFSILNLVLVAVYLKQKKNIIGRFIAGFFISSAFVSIVAEQLTVHLYNYLVDTSVIHDTYNFIFIFMSVVFDALFIFLGGSVFTYSTGLYNYEGATIYMEYVCLERICLILATDYANYVVIFFVLHFITLCLFYKDLPYLFKSPTLNWRRVFFNLLGLFYMLDILYSSYLIFPELGTGVINIQNIFWLDSMALVASIFVAGYIKISISESREHDGKLEYFQKLQNAQEDIIITLTEISEAKSGETGQHVRRVSEYSKLLATKLGLSFEEAENIRIASMMHDLGKLMISHEIIEKPDKLTPAEYDIVKLHTQYGWDILSKSDGELIKLARTIAAQHHEYWNGKGYPIGLSGSAISLPAQIVAVADVFDALTSKRAYKEAWPVEAAKEEIIKQRGEQFSPRVVDAFLKCYDMICVIKDTYQDEY